MTDTHCHLSFSRYDTDPTSPAGLRGAGRDAVLTRAKEAGVMWIINPGTDLKQSRAAVELAESTSGVSPSTPEVYAAVGVHPQDIGTLTADAFDALKELARHPRVVAIGEVGFEASSRAADLKRQEEWLERFCDLALEVAKPVIFHVREAHAEFREFLETDYRQNQSRADSRFRGNDQGNGSGRGVRGVVHCFSGTLDDAKFYTERGLFLGITGIVTYPNAEALREIVRVAPLDRLLLETDAPFLAPQSRRGKRNEPAYLREIAEMIAELKGLTAAEIERRTDDNARTLFGIS